MPGSEPSSSGQHLNLACPALLRLAVTSDGPLSGQTFDSGSSDPCTLTVGRTKHSKVFLKNPAVSETHAEFIWTGRSWAVRDLGSSNGTRVNQGEALQPYVPHVLEKGDRVLFGGEVELEVEFGAVAVGDLSVEQLVRMAVAPACRTLEELGLQRGQQLAAQFRSAVDVMAAPLPQTA